MNMKLFVATVAMFVGLAASQANAAEIKVGTLICDVQPGWGLVLGSRKAVECEFHNLDGEVSVYHGYITRVGLDVGFTDGGHIVWAVLAPSAEDTQSISGTYFGIGAEGTVVAGIGANALIGGFDNSINLQPISVSAQLGLDVALGLSSMHLIPN